MWKKLPLGFSKHSQSACADYFDTPCTQAQDLSLNEDLTNFASSPRGEGRLYNPYEGLSNAVDPRVLRSVYKLPSQPEFLFSEQATVHRRSWSENLTYYTGTGYATGMNVFSSVLSSRLKHSIQMGSRI